MNYKQRSIEHKLSELFRYYPIVAVLGARQVGKTTLVENLFTEARTVVFDPVIDVGGARQDPDFFLQNANVPAFFDEIQYAPELLSSIKRWVDREKKNGLFVLSGSQNLAVLKDISESLAGRVAIQHLWPMSRKEIIEEPTPGFLETWLSEGEINLQMWVDRSSEPVYPRIWRGGYPKIMELPDHMIPSYWQSYLQTYIERDVRAVANIGSLQTFGRFIGLLAALSGQEINHNQIGRELGVDRKTALAWTQIAEATYQWITVPAFSRNPVKKITGMRKGYFADTGFICFLQKISDSEVIGSHPMKGRLFETYVCMEIIKNLQKLSMSPHFYHFRSHSGAEVDLILEINGCLFPIEIKAKSNPTRKDVRGFAVFRECFPKETIKDGLLICSIDQPRRLSENVIAIPWWLI
ncbi:MAG: ATP-binding protein [SAR324 cluster bacterium]|nr:ATP-binding protein [SAR324 cluster bacterium]